MKLTSAIGVFLAAGAILAMLTSGALGQISGGGMWPTLHYDYENKRTTFEEGPDLSTQNLTIHWSFESGRSRSNPLIDPMGRLYVMGYKMTGLGPTHALYCVSEAVEDETDCTIVEPMWQSSINGYSRNTWSTGAISPNGDRFYMAAGSGSVALDCYDPMGNPDSLGEALLIFSTPFPGGESEASDIMLDTNTNTLYVFGNLGGASACYGFNLDGELTYWHGMPPQDPVPGEIAASPALNTVTYTYYDYTPGDPGMSMYRTPGTGTYWMGVGQPKTVYGSTKDGFLVAMHTIVETTWSPPLGIQPPPPPPMGDPEPVKLKWSYLVSSTAAEMISSPLVVERNWMFQKEPVFGMTPPSGEGMPPMRYNHQGVTTCTIYICDPPSGVVYCIEDSYYDNHDWEQIGWIEGDPPTPIWVDNNDEVGFTEEGFPVMMGAFPRCYGAHLRWTYDCGEPIAATPVLTLSTLYVVSETTLHAIDIGTGMDPNTNYMGESEGWLVWGTQADPEQPDDDWLFTADPDYGVAPSPTLDGNGLLWLVTSDGWLQVVDTIGDPENGIEPGGLVLKYFIDTTGVGDLDHQGDESPPFYNPFTAGEPLDMVTSPIIANGCLYVTGHGMGKDPASGNDVLSGWLFKVKPNFAGRYRFPSVEPEFGYTEGNRMGRIPTVFKYNIDYFDPDCSRVGTLNANVDTGALMVPCWDWPDENPENSIVLYVDGFHTFWRDEAAMGMPPFHIGPGAPNPTRAPAMYGNPPWGIWEGMEYQSTLTGDDERLLGLYEYKTDGSISNPALREYLYYNQNGCFNYFFEKTDGFGLNAPLVSEVFTGPNMCPELFFKKAEIVFDGTIARPYKSIIDLSVWYYDSDEDSPAATDVLLDDITYSMTGNSVLGNAAQPWEDRYSSHIMTSNDSPSYHYEFTDSPSEVHPEWPRTAAVACTTRHPEYGQFFTLILRDGRVTPAVGPPGNYVYSVRFYDPERRSSGINTGQEGSLNAHIYIDNSPDPFDMELLPGNGSQFDGLYTYQTYYPEYGEHTFRFDFFFEDSMPDYNAPRSGRGNLTSDPNGESSGPDHMVEQHVVRDRARAPEFVYVGPTISPWPSFNRYQNNNALDGATVGPEMPIVDTLYFGEPIKGTPVVGGSESTVFAGFRDGRVRAVTGDFSQVKWEFDTGDFVDCTASLGQEGSVIVASRDGQIIALDSATGQFRWLFSAANIADSSPCVGVTGDIYIGSFSGTFYSIDGRRGALNWSYDLPSRGAIQCCAAEGTDSTVYFGSYDNYVYSLNSAGVLLWVFNTGSIVNCSPAVETNGNVDSVYIGADNQYVYRLDYDFAVAGNPVQVWKYRTGGRIAYSSPAIDGQNVYIASDALYALDKDTGELAWSFVPDGDIFGSVAIDACGTVFFGASDARLYAVRPPTDPDYVARKEGELVWWLPVGSEIWVSGAAISSMEYQGESPYLTNGYHGDLYFGCWDGNLYRVSDRGYNVPPVLTDPSLSPSIGDASQSFRFGVHYSDADGDRPSSAEVIIDGIPYDMTFTGLGTRSNGEYEYYSEAGLWKGTHSYYFRFMDGNWAGNVHVALPDGAPEEQFVGPVVDNKPELYEASVTPAYGSSDQEFVFSVGFTDPDGDSPVSSRVVIDGVWHAMTAPSDEGETPANGKYTYTTTGAQLGVGEHAYRFEFEYSPDEWIRIPVVGNIAQPRVNNSPVLTDGVVWPLKGATDDEYTYSVHYFDVDNHPPMQAEVVIDGISHDMSLYSDFDSDGTYRLTIGGELIGFGSHIFYFDFEDTQGGRTMLPASGEEPFDGPDVNALPMLSGGQVSPVSGDADVDFVFSVRYSDPDGIRPQQVALMLDGRQLSLTLEEGIITDGLYARTISGSEIGLGDDHSFYFTAIDDTGSTSRFPESSGEDLHGPAVIEPGIYIPFWQASKTTHVDTTLVVGNAGTSQLGAAVDVSIHLYEGLGFETDTITHTIAPGEQVKVNFSDSFDDPLLHMGTAKISWDRGSIAVWAMIENGESEAVSMTLREPQIRQSCLPYWQVSSESTIDTFLAMNNIGGSLVDVAIQFYNAAGAEVGATSFTVQPRVLSTVWVSELVSEPEAVGSAVMTWDRGVLALWGMITSSDTNRAYEVSFNQPSVQSIDLPYWIYQPETFGRGGKGIRSITVPERLIDEPERVDADLGEHIAATLSGKVDRVKNLQAIDGQGLLYHSGGDWRSSLGAPTSPASEGDKARLQNTPPVLSNEAFDPEAPTTLEPVSFSIDYVDADGDAPVESYVAIVLDRTVTTYRDMTLEEGVDYDGRYSYQTYLPAGVHEVFFLFSDGENAVRYPKETVYTLTVTEESQGFDTWLVITNLTDKSGPAIVSLFKNTGEVVGNPQVQLPGLNTLGMIKLSQTSTPVGYGSGLITMGVTEPVINAWGLIYSETFETGFTLNLDSRYTESMYIPYWSINDEYGVSSWVTISNRGDENGVVVVNLFDDKGTLAGITDAEIAPNQLWFVDVKSILFGSETKMNGRGTVIWDGGEYLLYGAISDLTNRTSYPLAFVHPSVHR